MPSRDAIFDCKRLVKMKESLKTDANVDPPLIVNVPVFIRLNRCIYSDPIHHTSSASRRQFLEGGRFPSLDEDSPFEVVAPTRRQRKRDEKFGRERF